MLLLCAGTLFRFYISTAVPTQGEIGMVTRVCNSRGSARIGHGGKVVKQGGVSPSLVWGRAFAGKRKKRIVLAKLNAIVAGTVADNCAHASIQGHTALLQDCVNLRAKGVDSIVVDVVDCAHVRQVNSDVKVLYKFVCESHGYKLSGDILCQSVFEEIY